MRKEFIYLDHVINEEVEYNKWTKEGDGPVNKNNVEKKQWSELEEEV